MQIEAFKDKEEKHAKGMMDAQAVKVCLFRFYFAGLFYATLVSISSNSDSSFPVGQSRRKSSL